FMLSTARSGVGGGAFPVRPEERETRRQPEPAPGRLLDRELWWSTTPAPPRRSTATPGSRLTRRPGPRAAAASGWTNATGATDSVITRRHERGESPAAGVVGGREGVRCKG
ncbi:MAG: hypothetical protein ACK58T_25045, partial [Phycisphaerae bacterium]